MLKRGIFLLILIFNCSSLAEALEIKTTYQLEKHVESFSKTDLMQVLREFIEVSKPNRFIGTKGHLKSRGYLIKKIKELDKEKSGELEVLKFTPDIVSIKKFYQEDFDKKIKPNFKEDSEEYKKWKKFTDYMISLVDKKKETQGENIVWSKKSQVENAATIILTAHYDTVSIDKKSMTINEKDKMPGADYNASGVSILLGLIKTIAPLDIKKNIKVVFLDYQSLGFAGSLDYARKVKEDKTILGVINLEMLGNDSTFFDKLKRSGNMKMYMRDQKTDPDNKDEFLGKIITKNSKKFDAGIRFEPLKNNFKGSDNWRFWEEGIASVTLSQDWENDFNQKRYQTSNDFPETLNQNTFYRSYLYVAGSVATFLDVL